MYAWAETTLVRHEYASLGRAEKGLVRRYLAQMTGLSRAQVTRLIAGYRTTRAGEGDGVSAQQSSPTRYTAADVDLLAYVDKAHGNLSGPATRRILEREYGEYGQAVYERLAGISVAQLYRLPQLGGLSQAQYKLSADAAHADPDRRAAQAAAARADPDTCASTRCIRAIKMAAKACITSTRWTR